MDTSRLNHIAGLIARKGSGGKLTGTEQQDVYKRQQLEYNYRFVMENSIQPDA